MKLIHSSINSMEAHIVKNMLENNGIECTVKNENLKALAGRVPFQECFIELWVQDGEDSERALKILDEFKRKNSAKQTQTWQCAKCHEKIESQFDSCWNCGADNLTALRQGRNRKD